MPITIDVSQLLRLSDDLLEIDDLAVELVEHAIDRGAKNIEATMKDLAPVGATGDLKRSIGIDRNELSADIGPTVFYAPFLEFGTAHQSPQPFAEPAFERHQRQIHTEIEVAVMTAVRKKCG